ncbi:aminoglycoside phosphotransferase family protein [Fictibacillus nanhaiensis]|uniref:aminoglycoside phosphotransferase family protein n=1 Tax=Fictibacillus nanhaiensis TaxID=742169 RepID=UPI002040B0FD|nr:aminoglycoside phosphotransferase family protein [Fictibacillus nanhaiensis]MCM3732659.1 aminoglycoside phosphotransferase family protein [Fictibacillus nanhaiensis]
MRLPDKFVKTMKSIHKDKAKEWLNNFDQMIAAYEERLEISIQGPFDLSYNFVAPAIRNNGQEVVIKVVLSRKEFLGELETLRLMKGKKMVELLEYDVDRGIMILERLSPGVTLAVIEDDEEAAYIASEVMKSLWVPAPNKTELETVSDRENSLKRIFNNNPNGFGPISKETLQEALSVFEQLNGQINHSYLLHGDLHHYNLLKNGDSWSAIDPKGLIGDREYDVIQYLLNKLPEKNVKDTIKKRVDIFVNELNLDKERVLLRGFSHAVLSTCWSIEEGNFTERQLNTIEAFKELCKP